MPTPPDTNRVRLKRIYDRYRTVRMNREYYACRLEKYQRINLAYEVVLALGASSAVAGLYFWQTALGKDAWGAFGVAVIILSVLKPVLQIPKKVERYSKLYAGYSALFYDLKGVVEETRANGGIDPQAKGLIEKADARYRELGIDDDPNPSRKLLTKCEESVRQGMPSFKEWWPEQTT